MNQLRIGARLFLLAMIVVSGLFGSSIGRVAAQSGATSFTSPMTGIQIQTSGPWTIDTSTVLSEGGVESITLNGEYDFMQLWFLPGNVDLVEARDVVLDSYAQTFGTFVEIDRGAYGNVSYSLDITSAEGIEFGVFSLFLGQRDSGYVEYYVYFGALSLFAGGFATAQQNVTVNGTAVFGGVDGVGLQNLLLANAGVTGTAPGTTTQQPSVPPTPAPEQPTQPTNQPTQPTTQPTQIPAQDDGPASNDGAIYLETLQGEVAYLDGTVTDFLNNYFEMSTNAEAAVGEMNRVAAEWAAYPQRAAGVVAPAGYEALDASYRDIVTEASALAGLWEQVLQSAQAQDGTTNTKLADLIVRVLSFQVMIDELEVAVTNQGGTTSPSTTAQPTQAPADTPTQTTETGGTELTADQQAYLDTVRSETEALQGSIGEFVSLFQQWSEGTGSDQTVTDMNTIIDLWSGYPDYVQSIPVPAGMEEVDASYRQLASDFSTAAATFMTAINAGAEGDTAALEENINLFSSQLEALDADSTSLLSLVSDYESSGSTSTTTTTTTTTTTPTEAPAETPESPSAGSADGDAYLSTIAAETQAIQDSINSFFQGFDMLTNGTPAEQDEGAVLIRDAVDYWSTYDQVASGIVVPAGYEDVDAAYRQVAGDVTNLPVLFGAWIDATEATQETAAQEFLDAVTNLETRLLELQAMAGGDSQSGTTTTTPPSTTTPDEPQDEPADQPTGDITETGNRGQLPQRPGGDQPQDSGSTGGDEEDLGLVADDEYVSPQYALEVVWDDRWMFDGEYIEDAIGSSEETGEDWITLVWTGGSGGDITVTVTEADGLDPADAVAFWESDEYLDGIDLPTEVVLSESSSDRGGVMILVDDGEEGLVLYREAVCLSRRCDEVAFVLVTSGIRDTADIVADAEEGIEIEGEPATGVFSTREINRALDQ